MWEWMQAVLVGHYWEIATLAAVITAVMTAITAFMLFYFLKQRSLSHYDESRHQAQLSEIKKAFDKEIHELNMNLLSTEQRWREINHLLISAQQAQPTRSSTTKVAYTRFLKAAGINEEDLDIDPKLVLMLTPFDPLYYEAYKTVVGVCQRAGLQCLRGDETYTSEDILRHILRLMIKARVVIANVSGRNPNVFYELGIAHALDKATILISESLTQVPFDVQSKRIIVYTNNEELKKEITETLLRTLAELINA